MVYVVCWLALLPLTVFGGEDSFVWTRPDGGQFSETA